MECFPSRQMKSLWKINGKIFFKHRESCNVIYQYENTYGLLSTLRRTAGEKPLAEALIGYCMCRAHLINIKQILQKEELLKVKLKSFTTLFGFV